VPSNEGMIRETDLIDRVFEEIFAVEKSQAMKRP
jgi:hypothetical protein